MEDDEAMHLDPPNTDPPEYDEAISTVRQAIAAMDEGMEKVDAEICIEGAIANLRSDDEDCRSRGRKILTDILVRIGTKPQASPNQLAPEQGPTADSNEDIHNMMASEMLGTPDSTQNEAEGAVEKDTTPLEVDPASTTAAVAPGMDQEEEKEAEKQSEPEELEFTSTSSPA